MTPNPGSKEAGDAGCTCPVLDNSHGLGYLGVKGIFVINDNCPVHVPADRDRREQQDQPPAWREASNRERAQVGEPKPGPRLQLDACGASA